MYCPKCGNEISNDAKFCKVCGMAMEAPVMRVSVASATTPVASAVPGAKKKSKKGIILILGVLVALLMAGGGFAAYKFIFSNPSHQPTDPIPGSNLAVFHDGWVYTNEGDKIVRVNSDHPDGEKDVLHVADSEKDIDCIWISNDWIYFRQGVEGSDVILYRIKQDGSSKTEYVLKGNETGVVLITEEEIYYDKSDNLEPKGIYAINLSSGTERALIEGHYLWPLIIDGWIFYSSSSLDGEVWLPKDLYRMRLNGTKNEKVITSDTICTGSFMDGQYIYFGEREGEHVTFKKKKIGGGEVRLGEIKDYKGSDYLQLIKNNDWLYYSFGKKVYRLNTGGGEPELFYSITNDSISKVSRIAINDEKVVLYALREKDDYPSVFICLEEDGTEIFNNIQDER